MAGVCIAGGHAWWGGMCSREHSWPGGMCGRGACVAGETATAVDGTHPTGMDSCFKKFFPIMIREYGMFNGPFASMLHPKLAK